MSKLREKLKLKKCPSRRVTVEGETFVVTGLSLAAVGRLTASCRNSVGKLNGERLDAVLLAACVSDPDDGSTMTAEEWPEIPRAITGPLMSVVMKLCGLDKDDVQLGPNDSGSTES